ncbi:Uncharacterised protein [uncultured Blautia sp.]|nr:Uncharacterised protein [uncultured Blautia sp.]
MEGQDVKGLADEGEDAQPGQVLPHVVGVQQAHRQAVAEDREGQSADPAEHAHLREKGAADVVDQHGGDGDELQQIRVQIGFQPWPRLGDGGGSGEHAPHTGAGDGSGVCHGVSLLVDTSVPRKKSRRKRGCHLRRPGCQVLRWEGRGCQVWRICRQVWFGRRRFLW